MRANIEKTASPDEQKNAARVAEVWFDGVKQLNCVALDTETGEVTRYRVNPDGSFVYSGGSIERETVRGTLVVMMMDGTNHVTTPASVRDEHQSRGAREGRVVDWFKINRSFS